LSRAETNTVQKDLIADEIPQGPDVSVTYDALASKEPIGGGGSADVFKTVFSTPEEDTTLAIKEPRMSSTIHMDQVDRILQEAKTWNQLTDDNHIVDVVDWGGQPVPWIAMEYMDGGHLGDRIDEMDIEQALWTALAITKGVRHAHSKGVAHLDLKPENILFRSVADAWDVPKVADWGLSKHLLKQSKSIQGMSPHYAAPEQFETERASPDNVTDVYQLGAVFYELFTGHPPFEGRPTEVMRAVMDDQPTPPSEIADVPEALDKILLTALAKQREDRYGDIIYLRDALQELFDTGV
jgi:serine/threonine protein kinase